MKKIPVLDLNEKDKAESYFKGFNVGVFNTVGSIVELRHKGLSLAKLYKLIEKKHKEEVSRLRNEGKD